MIIIMPAHLELFVGSQLAKAKAFVFHESSSAACVQTGRQELLGSVRPDWNKGWELCYFSCC